MRLVKTVEKREQPPEYGVAQVIVAHGLITAGLNTRTCRVLSVWSSSNQMPRRDVVADDRAMYGIPDNFCLSSFREATLISVQLGQFQVNLRFDGHNRGVSIQSRYALVAPGGEAEEFTAAPAGAAALAALLGAQLENVAGTADGTLTLTFATKAKVIVFDDSAQYESYQIHDGDDLIVV